MKPLAFGIGVGAGIQAWRNWPPDGPVSADMGVLVMVVGIVLAYLGGRARRPAGAAAVAVAQAEATATSQVNLVVMNGRDDTAGYGGVRVPEPGAVSWMGHDRAQVTTNDLDGLDLDDLGALSQDQHPDALQS